MIESFKIMKPKKIEQLSDNFEGKIFQEKIDGSNVVIDLNLPEVSIIHARTVGSKLIWNMRGYRYPELVEEIQKGNVLKNNCTYIGELTCLDKDGIGRLWLFSSRSHLENTFQIRRMSKLCPVTFYPHHIVRDGDQRLFDLTYEEILQILGRNVKEGNHIQQIPTYSNPKPLLEQKGLIEGIVAKDKNSIYHKGKRGYGWVKKKFLKEKTVKFIAYEQQEIGIKMFSDENKPVHLAGNRVKTAIREIEDNGFVICELEFYAETNKGWRDCSIKRVLEKKKEQEI